MYNMKLLCSLRKGFFYFDDFVSLRNKLNIKMFIDSQEFTVLHNSASLGFILQGQYFAGYKIHTKI